MKHHVLVLIPLPDHTVSELSRLYNVHYQPEAGQRPPLDTCLAEAIDAVVTNGSTGCKEELILALPNLKVVSSFGAGYENVDIAAARKRGIQVTHAPGANAATVADHAIGFALALARDYCNLTAAVKKGYWKSSRQERAALNGSTVGIVGMGRVGRLIAQRAFGFDAKVAYFDVAPKVDLAASYYPDVKSLAAASDFLIAACPGGPATRHIVNYEVMKALGPESYVINVARGTVLKSDDLIRALQENLIAGAALDVLEEEPNVPAALLDSKRVLLTPHIAGRSPASLLAQKESVLESLQQALSGVACRLQVPELR